MLAACGGEPPALTETDIPLQIGLGELPVADEGESYEARLRAFGGDATDYRWRLAEGAPPPGLFLRSEGTPETTLSGVPRAAGRFSFTVEVEDAAGGRARAEFVLEVRAGPEPVRILTSELPPGSLLATYSAPLEAEGGDALLWRLISGELPPGIELVDAEGPRPRLEGQPQLDGRFSFTLRVENAAGDRDARALSISVQSRDRPLEIAQARLAPAELEVLYEATLVSSGGRGRHRWSLVSGEFPRGLELTSDGGPTARITGVPTLRGIYAFRVEVRDDADRLGRQTFSLEVRTPPPPIRILPFELPAGTAGETYDAALRVVGGSGPPYAWSVRDGELPAGLALTGVGLEARISGVPAQAGRFTFLIRAEDDIGARGEASFTLDIADAPPPVTITATRADARGVHRLPEARLGAIYPGRLVATGGAPAQGSNRYNWVVASGDLPPGLRLSSSGQGPTGEGRFEGRPTTRGTFEATVQVYDNQNGTDDQRVSITVR